MRIPAHPRIPVAARVARLRKLVQTDSYQINLDALAARIVAEELIRTENN
jgi:hypothetical protein